jgi:hypothetical protein
MASKSKGKIAPLFKSEDSRSNFLGSTLDHREERHSMRVSTIWSIADEAMLIRIMMLADRHRGVLTRMSRSNLLDDPCTRSQGRGKDCFTSSMR